MEEHVWLGCFGKAKKQKALQSLGWMHSLRCERGEDTNGAYESNSKTQQSQKAQQTSSSYDQCAQCEVEKQNASPNCAPAKSEFEEVWKDVRSGKAALRSKRTKKIAYSLQEAVKTKRQRLVLQAKGGTLFRDESKNRLSCRLRVVNKQFQRSTFHLGNKRDPGYGASALTNATEHIMKTFSTRFANAPLTKVRSVFKADVYKSLQDHIFAVCTDAAADELLSAKMMQVPPLREQDGVAALLPKFRFTIRDTAHAARRIISRPWAASPKLKHAAGVFGRYSHSLGQRVHHSPKYRSVFKNGSKLLLIMQNTGWLLCALQSTDWKRSQSQPEEL